MTETIMLKIIGMYEEKLKELMTEKEFDLFTSEVSRKAFKAEIELMPDCEFKQVILDHFDDLTR